MGEWPTPDLLLQAEDDCDCLVQDEQFGLRLLAFQMQLAHAAQLLKRLVDVSHSQPLSCVIGHPPLTLTFCLLLRVEVLVLVNAAVEENRNTCQSQAGSKAHNSQLTLETVCLFPTVNSYANINFHKKCKENSTWEAGRNIPCARPSSRRLNVPSITLVIGLIRRVVIVHLIFVLILNFQLKSWSHLRCKTTRQACV